MECQVFIKNCEGLAQLILSMVFITSDLFNQLSTDFLLLYLVKIISGDLKVEHWLKIA